MLNTTYYVYSFFILKCTDFIHVYIYPALLNVKAFLQLQKMFLNTNPICYWSDNQIAPPQTRVLG